MLLGVVSALWSLVCIIAVKGNGEWVEDISSADRLWYTAVIFKGKATRRVVKDLLLCEPHISDYLFLLLLALVLQGTASNRGQGHWPASDVSCMPVELPVWESWWPALRSKILRFRNSDALIHFPSSCLTVPWITFLLLVGNRALYHVLWWDNINLPLAGWGFDASYMDRYDITNCLWELWASFEALVAQLPDSTPDEMNYGADAQWQFIFVSLIFLQDFFIPSWFGALLALWVLRICLLRAVGFHSLDSL